MELYQVEISIDNNLEWLDIWLTKEEHRNPEKFICEKIQKKYNKDEIEVINIMHIGAEAKI